MVLRGVDECGKIISKDLQVKTLHLELASHHGMTEHKGGLGLCISRNMIVG